MSTRLEKYILLVGLFLMILACGRSVPPSGPVTQTPENNPTLTRPTSTPEIVPSATPIPTETPPPTPTPTATPELFPPQAGQPLDPLALLTYNTATGVWTEGEGLVILLKLFLGEIDPAGAAYVAELEGMELTGLIAQAEAYLAAHPEAPEKAALEDVLAPFRITDEALDLYSAPETTSLSDLWAHGIRARENSSQTAQDTYCADLFRRGFPPGSATLCYRYNSFTDHGNEYRLYYPETWAFDDPRRAKLLPLKEAMKLAVQTFNGYGFTPILPIRMVVTELGYTREDGSLDASVYAQAIRGRDDTCRVGVFPSALNLDQSEMSQTIAHELFHCFQYTNLSAQEHGPDPSANKWWVEGSATYFSDVVYPGANAEADWNWTLPRLATRTPLVLWSYSAYAFFEYLGNNLGWSPSQIINLLAAMPTSGEKTEQLITLTEYPGMLDTFHTFGQALIDNRVRETGGDTIEVDIQPREIIALPPEAGNPILPTTNSFVLDYYEIVLEQNKDYTFTPQVQGSVGRHSATLTHTATWTGLPGLVSTACQETRYRVLVTAGHPFNAYQYTLAYATADSSVGCDTCLAGTWRLDTGSYLLLATSLSPKQPENNPAPTFMISAEGEVSLTFVPDTLAFQSTMNNLALNSIMLIKDPDTLAHIRTSFITVRFNGGGSGTYSAANGEITLNYSSLTTDVKAYLDGELAGTFLPPGGVGDPGAMTGTNAPYICTDTALLIGPTAPILRVNPIAPWLAFYKVTP
ncbi:MAG: hypothetical protein Fur0022_31090 [Anaerolineales bacterium]